MAVKFHNCDYKHEYLRYWMPLNHDYSYTWIGSQESTTDIKQSHRT